MTMGGEASHERREAGAARDSAAGLAGSSRRSVREIRSVRVSRACHEAGSYMVDLSLFVRIAEYLEDEGWIAEADPDYWMFTVTVAGLDEAMR